MTSRRHGEELERALLDAAWSELTENGYASFTMDAVAARAGTSRPVLYRRWSDKHALVRAAVAAAVDRGQAEVPDTGTLRGDTLAMMKLVSATRLEVFAALTVHLGGFYRETGTTPADLRKSLRAGRQRAPQVILERARARGEIPDRPIADRIAELPYTLLNQEFLMTLKAVPNKVLEEIADTIFLPLVVPRTP